MVEPEVRTDPKSQKNDPVVQVLEFFPSIVGTGQCNYGGGSFAVRHRLVIGRLLSLELQNPKIKLDVHDPNVTVRSYKSTFTSRALGIFVRTFRLFLLRSGANTPNAEYFPVTVTTERRIHTTVRSSRRLLKILNSVEEARSEVHRKWLVMANDREAKEWMLQSA
ncbi:hypothetical protein Q9189_001923 [Teloschistes chrysophthalmus]